MSVVLAGGGWCRARAGCGWMDGSDRERVGPGFPSLGLGSARLFWLSGCVMSGSASRYGSR